MRQIQGHGKVTQMLVKEGSRKRPTSKKLDPLHTQTLMGQTQRIKCPKCPKTFSGQSGLNFHLPKHTGNFKFWCEMCQKGFGRSSDYEDHMRKHEGRLHFCEYCAKSFQSSRGLELHLREHTGKYPFYCRTCGAGFSLQKKLEIHENQH